MPVLPNAFGVDEDDAPATVAELDLNGVGTDPGMFLTPEQIAEQAEDDTPKESASASTMSSEEKRATVESVLALLGRSLRPAGANPGSSRSAVPSARARAALDTLVQLGTIEALDATQPNLRAMCVDLFNWHSPDGQNRANGNVVKAFGAALTARNEAGASLYSQAVEMAGFASAAAPLLQPDRLARIITLAPTVATAFSPDRYTMQFTKVLRAIVARYPEQRREQLLATLWTASHEGRWWDMTAGITQPDMVRRAEDEDLDALVREAAGRAGVTDPEDESELIDAFLAGKLPYNRGTIAIASRFTPTAKLVDGLNDIGARARAGEHIDPDIALLTSHMGWLQPNQRPESPVVDLVKSLVSAITPDPVTGEAYLKSLPEKPKSWKDLYPKAPPTEFPYPSRIRHLEGYVLPGTDDGAHGPARIELIKSPAELAANAEYMGNCTYSYLGRIQQGRNVLFKVWQDGSCYNVALWRGDRMRYNDDLRAARRWTVGEVNSRFNRGNVPASISAGIARLVDELGVPEPLPDYVLNPHQPRR